MSARRRVRKVWAVAGLIILVLFAGLQLFQPPAPTAALAGEEPISAHIPVPDHVGRLLRESCYDCHSDETRWPWYARISPVSWLIANDVRHGRGDLDEAVLRSASGGAAVAEGMIRVSPPDMDPDIMRPYTKSFLAVVWLSFFSSACRQDVLSAPTVALSCVPILSTAERDRNVDIYTMDTEGGERRRLTAHAAVDQSADWSPDESYTIAFMSNRDGDFEIFTMFVNGRGLLQLTDNDVRDGFPRWSPDGSRILFTSFRDGNFELYVMRADGTEQTRLTFNDEDDIGGAWSPDGSRIAFASARDGDHEIYVMRPDGTDPVRLTNNALIEGSRIAWSPDGSKLAFYAFRDLRDGNADIYLVDADGRNETQLTHDLARDRWPMWTPDGRQIAFTSDRDGDDEIYVTSADGSGLLRLTDGQGLDVLDAWRC